MPRRMMTLGLMQAATRGHDPIAMIDWDLRTHLIESHQAKAQDWLAAAEQQTRRLTRGDVLWTCIAPIAIDWLILTPLYAVPYGTSDRNVLRPLAVFVGNSPRKKQHQGLIWYSLIDWARGWCRDYAL